MNKFIIGIIWIIFIVISIASSRIIFKGSLLDGFLFTLAFILPVTVYSIRFWYWLLKWFLHKLMNFLHTWLWLSQIRNWSLFKSKLPEKYITFLVRSKESDNWSGFRELIKYITDISMLLPRIITVIILIGLWQYIILLGVDDRNFSIHWIIWIPCIILYFICYAYYASKTDSYRKNATKELNDKELKDIDWHREYFKKSDDFKILKTLYYKKELNTVQKKYILNLIFFRWIFFFISIIYMSLVWIISYYQFKWDKEICTIKWNISTTQEKIYHTESCDYYYETTINENRWEKRFCTEQEALINWRRKAKNCQIKEREQDYDYIENDYDDYQYDYIERSYR